MQSHINNTLSSNWQKATAIGSVWGAFEIVAGSILHNFAIPLVAGTVLSALGVIIMVSGFKVFGGKGIFLRSALVCAALKTVSPSHVILSPMIGITLEGLLMETGVFILGNNISGLMLGGGLAVISVLGFKFIRLIMIYGIDLIEAYRSVFSFTFNNDFMSSKGYLLPIFFLVLVYLIIGATTTFIGYKGGLAIQHRFTKSNIQLLPLNDEYKPPIVKGYKGGIGFLFFHIIWLVAFILLKNLVPNIFWISGGILYIALCMFRYGRIRVLMAKPILWLVIILVSITSAFFIHVGKSGGISISSEIILQSFQILLRAMVVIISFASIGIEVKSKGVSQQFRNSKFSHLGKSFGIAQVALPKLISTLRTGTKHIYKPLPIIERMFSIFVSHDVDNIFQKSIYIVTADKQGGKTTFIKELIAYLESFEIKISGFYADGFWNKDQQRSGFNLVTLPKKNSLPLCDRTSTKWEKYGAFYFNPEAIELGKETLNNAESESVIFIDEIGLFELEDKLWAESLTGILKRDSGQLVVTVRRSFIDEVSEKWKLTNVTIVDSTIECPEKIGKAIISNI
jgi:nucleoside-triphosphatase THEP1